MSTNEITTVTEEISPSVKLVLEGNELSKKALEAKTPQELEEIKNLFRMNIAKKDIVRANKLYGVLELVDDEVYNRVACTPEGINNIELIKYKDSTEAAINNIKRSIDNSPEIQITAIDNSVNISGLKKDSRVNVADFVNFILGVKEEAPSDIIIETPYEPVEDEE